MKTRVILYTLGIGIFALASAIYGDVVNGKAITPGGLLTTVLVLPVFGYLIWLRWDWAPAEKRKRSEERARRNAPSPGGTE